MRCILLQRISLLAIVARLCGDGPLSTITLKEQTGVSRQGVSKHLRLLEQSGLALPSCADPPGFDQSPNSVMVSSVPPSASANSNVTS